MDYNINGTQEDVTEGEGENQQKDNSLVNNIQSH